MTMTDLTVDGFIDEVSAGSPAPGGGSVSALAAALAAALVSMVGSLTLRRLVGGVPPRGSGANPVRSAVGVRQASQGAAVPGHEGAAIPLQPAPAKAADAGALGQHSASPEVDLEADMTMAVDIATDLRRHFVQLIAEDAEAFGAVMAAYRLPKFTDEERRARSAAIQAALEQACRVPAQVAKGAVEVLRLSDLVAREGVRSALSDAAVACLVANAALQGACLNVKINLRSVKNAAFASEMQGEITRAMSSGRAISESIMAFVQGELG